MMTKMQVALLGLGTVGMGVYNLISKNIVLTSQVEIKHILVKDITKQRDLNETHLLTNNFEEIINDESIQIIFESIGGINQAYHMVKRALENKIHVITSNKALVDYYGHQLFPIAKENNVYLLFEASVVAGVPVISNMYDILKLERITSIQGILNGSSNTVLTRVFKNHISFNDAVEEAQSKGFLEADPKDDLGGFDALRKLSIMSKIAYQKQFTQDNLYRHGIEGLNNRFVQYLQNKNLLLKQIAKSVDQHDQISLIVEPIIIQSHHRYAHILYEYNIIELETSIRQTLSFSGKGAGRYPTAQGMIMDLHLLLSNKAYRFNHDNAFSQQALDEEVTFLVQTDRKEVLSDYIDLEDGEFIITKKVSRKLMKTLEDTFIYYARLDLID